MWNKLNFDFPHLINLSLIKSAKVTPAAGDNPAPSLNGSDSHPPAPPPGLEKPADDGGGLVAETERPAEAVTFPPVTTKVEYWKEML